MYNERTYTDQIEQISAVGKDFFSRGWVPSTSGNVSMRLNETLVSVTVSGKDKGSLDSSGVMIVDLTGKPLIQGLRSSAETELHLQLYKMFPEINAVLHPHSPHSVVLSRLLKHQNEIRVQGYELLKAFQGITTHTQEIVIPIFENSQDMARLANEIKVYLSLNPKTYGYILRGHGLYTWGNRMEDARRNAETFDYLFDCELQLMRYQR